MKIVLAYDAMLRTIRRMGHEILEYHGDINNLIVLGIEHNGYPVAKLITESISTAENCELSCYPLDIRKYRDDEKQADVDIPQIDVNGKEILLVDDVIYTGRTARAALEAVFDLGRPKKITYAVLVDRGHREMPIRPDFVGKSIPTRYDEKIVVDIENERGIVTIPRQ